MFIVTVLVYFSSSVRSGMLTLHPYGAWITFNAANYKHGVPNGTENNLLPPVSCFLPPVCRHCHRPAIHLKGIGGVIAY